MNLPLPSREVAWGMIAGGCKNMQSRNGGAGMSFSVEGESHAGDGDIGSMDL